MIDELTPLREIAPEPERMLSVRRRVLAAIVCEAERTWPGRLLATAGMSLALAAWAFWPAPRPLDLALPPLEIEPPTFAFRLTPPRPKPARSAAPAPSPEKADIEIVRPTETGLLLRLASSDPDVVLYYLLENPEE